MGGGVCPDATARSRTTTKALVHLALVYARRLAGKNAEGRDSGGVRIDAAGGVPHISQPGRRGSGRGHGAIESAAGSSEHEIEIAGQGRRFVCGQRRRSGGATDLRSTRTAAVPHACFQGREGQNEVA